MSLDEYGMDWPEERTFERFEKLLVHRLDCDVTDAWYIEQLLGGFELLVSGWSDKEHDLGVDTLTEAEDIWETAIYALTTHPFGGKGNAMIPLGLSCFDYPDDLARYIIDNDIPDCVLRYMLLDAKASRELSHRTVVKCFMRAFLYEEVSLSALADLEILLCYDLFGYGYAEKITHLIAKGKYTPKVSSEREDGRPRSPKDTDRWHAKLNASYMARQSHKYDDLPEPSDQLVVAARALDAYQDGMKLRPGSIPTGNSLLQ